MHCAQEMFPVNPSLVEICLDSNFIGVKGKDALMAGTPDSSRTLVWQMLVWRTDSVPICRDAQ